MKKYTLRLAISSLLLTGSITVVVKIVHENNRQAPPSPPSVLTVLQAHGGYNDRTQSRFTQNATKTYHEDNSAIPQDARESKLKFSRDGSFVRLDNTSSSRNEMFLFNGQTMIRTTYYPKAQPKVKVLNGGEEARAKFQLATCGLLPILKRISDPDSQVVYIGATSIGHQFHVKTPRGVWDFYTNSNHLIDRVEVEGTTITYGDYRTVDGLNLPFYQQVRKGNKLIYELRLETVDFNPVFADGFFKSELF